MPDSPTPSFYVRQEERRQRAARGLIAAHEGSYLDAAQDAWERMESETNGTRANYWGAVCMIIQQMEAQSKGGDV